ncbi:hypothetical protein ACHHYP_20628 [Achlya hypogyna]|uniref:Vesicle transport protein USE1 n=1 Tax=Achlya hypogyna TaxID=1202772 RepID=A0A1V9YGR0_ACHHY|nr:hypothetical protein ACHHYP_20628 [Achlya hypogyna]
MEKDATLNCTPEYDELVGLLGDLHGLGHARYENNIFPPPEVLRRRRVEALERATQPVKNDQVDTILSQLEEHVQSGWEEQQANVMDDMSDLLDDAELFSVDAPTRRPELSTKSMREQLGLVGARANSSRSNISAEQSKEEKEALEAEMYRMTQNLKAYAHSYDESLQDDAALISSVAERAQANMDKLDSERARLDLHLSNGLTIWKTLLLIGIVFVVFIAMYIFMKLFGQRRYPLF